VEVSVSATGLRVRSIFVGLFEPSVGKYVVGIFTISSAVREDDAPEDGLIESRSDGVFEDGKFDGVFEGSMDGISVFLTSGLAPAVPTWPSVAREVVTETFSSLDGLPIMTPSAIAKPPATARRRSTGSMNFALFPFGSGVGFDIGLLRSS